MKDLFLFLKEHDLTISSCESFTAGLFANEFCQIAGASNYYQGGFICYSNEFKTNQLDIPDEIIKKYDVVSKEVATLMAANCAKILKTDLSFAFTGYAPKSDHPSVGLSYCGIYFDDKVEVIELNNKQIKNRLEYQQYAISQVLLYFKKISTGYGKTS